MRTYAGEQKLLKQNEIFVRKVEKIKEDVYFFTGFGGSNMIALIGEDGVVLIDALNKKPVAEDALQELRRITDKPIKTIIYTHYSHPDHISGAAVLAEEDTEIIGHTFHTAVYGYSNLIGDILRKRSQLQFGSMLTQEESIGIGIGIYNDPMLAQAPKKPNVIVDGDINKITRCGFDLELIASPGETDDQMVVWIPKYHMLCCGDNYYASFPNLYAIRGSQYRDISSWIESLDHMMTYPVEILLPGHTMPLYGNGEIVETLGNYRAALHYVLTETLTGMNQGMTIAQLVETVALPEHLAQLPYLQEYYGTVAWTVQAIYTGYLGWYDGNATKLGHMPVKLRAEKMVAMMGGADAVLEEIRSALQEREEDQWAAELCDYLLDAQLCVAEAKAYKAEALIHLGRSMTSANGRHYYLSAAKLLQQQ